MSLMDMKTVSKRKINIIKGKITKNSNLMIFLCFLVCFVFLSDVEMTLLFMSDLI